MKTFFITASGTEIGKTFVTILLTTQLSDIGYQVRALKPVATGVDPKCAKDSDTGLLLQALGLELSDENLTRVSPWQFNAALSPDMAAARENRVIDFEELVEFSTGNADGDITLIEGIGGVMVPLDLERTVLDWIQALDAPVLLVAGSYLGTLSHTLSAAGMLEARGQTVAGVILNESLEQPVDAEETAEVIRHFLQPTPVLVLPRLDGGAAAPDLLPLLDPYL